VFEKCGHLLYRTITKFSFLLFQSDRLYTTMKMSAALTIQLRLSVVSCYDTSLTASTAFLSHSTLA